MKASFSHIQDWVFDLDNTLYPSHCDLFTQMDERITHYVMRVIDKEFEEARIRQKEFYRDYGTTLRGLMSEHDIDPHDYLNDVHDIDYSSIPPNPELGELIGALPGRKHIFTNGDVAHTQRTLAALEIEGRFDRVFDIAHADFVPKPEPGPYDKFLADHGINPKNSAMFEDMPRNLEVPKSLGMSTILVIAQIGNDGPREHWELDGQDGEHIDHISDDLNQFISGILEAPGVSR